MALSLSFLICCHSLKKSKNRSSSTWNGGYSENQDYSPIWCGVRSTAPQTPRFFLQTSWKQHHSANLLCFNLSFTKVSSSFPLNLWELLKQNIYPDPFYLTNTQHLLLPGPRLHPEDTLAHRECFLLTRNLKIYWGELPTSKGKNHHTMETLDTQLYRQKGAERHQPPDGSWRHLPNAVFQPKCLNRSKSWGNIRETRLRDIL